MTAAVATALLHSLWQGALAAALTAGALWILRGATAQARYVVACAGLAAMLGAWTVTAMRSVPDVSNANVEGGLQTALKTASPAPAPPLLGPGFLDFSPAIRERRPSDLNQPVAPTWPARLERWSAAAVPLWFAGVVLLSLRVSAGWIGLERLRRRQVVPAAPDLAARVATLATRVRVSRPVRVAHSAAVHVPSVVGWLRPIILLPASALSGLSPAQLDAVLAHELAHVRRHDFAVNALQTVADVLLFYHPACWWLSRRVRVEREHCCDDIAVAVCGDRLTYAAALADLEALRQPPALALAATDGPLLHRVRRLIAPPHQGDTPTWAALALPLAVVAIVIGGVVVTKAQQAPEQVRVPGMGRTIPGDRGVITGQVVEAGTGRPIAGARVEARGPSDQVYVTTDDDGRYETRPLAPGGYAISVTAPGHAVAFYDGRAGSMSGQSSMNVEGRISAQPGGGAQRITMTGKVEIRKSITVDVGPGVLVSDIDLAMEPIVELSGRILDDQGRGLAGAHIQLVAAAATPLGTLPRGGFARSESDGVFRVTAPPGDYAVRAYIGTNVRPSREADLAYVATFYPGVRSQDAATLIRLSAGTNQYDVDFGLLSDRTVRVSGTVVDPAGHDLEDVSVSLQPLPSSAGDTSVELRLNAEGEFDARDVVPGTYVVNVTDPRRPERWRVPRPSIEIAEDITGLDIRAVTPASITGRVVRDPRSTGRLNLTQTVISFTNRGPGHGMSMSAFNMEEDGSFHGEVPPGSLTVMIMGPPSWIPRSIRLDGVDVFGYPLEVTSGAHEIEVVVTDRLGSVSGLVVDRRGAPLAGFDVVLFPQDETRWFALSPLIKQTRSHQNGQFEMPLVPPGDYLAVATEGVPLLLIGDPVQTLRRLQSIGTRLKVGDDEQKTISIRASPAPEGLARFSP